jgi:hypothetical protein
MVGWHQRLCHLNFRDVLKLASTGIIRINGSKTMPFCNTCQKAKQTRHISSTAAQRAVKPLARIHIDIASGGSSLGCSDNEALPAAKGIQYFMIITDDATRYQWIYFLQNRSEAVPSLKQWLQHMKNQGFGSPAFARSNREFVTEEIRNMCAEYGIHWEPTIGYSPWQNGVSERSICILLERSRAILFDAELPQHL